VKALHANRGSFVRIPTDAAGSFGLPARARLRRIPRAPTVRW
jgi:hypothetical protein